MNRKRPELTHQEQQQAVERIQELMSQGVSSGLAIIQVAEEIRAIHQTKREPPNNKKAQTD